MTATICFELFDRNTSIEIEAKHQTKVFNKMYETSSNEKSTKMTKFVQIRRTLQIVYKKVLKNGGT
jgi:hypothetical protein